jgi:aspartyl/asparaginyl beta-hydroxylase (cupin superfamily)
MAELTNDRTADIEAALKETARRTLGADASCEIRRADIFVERILGRRAVYHQQPAHLAYPGLPEIEFWDREAFPWLSSLEAATQDIRAEIAAILAEDADVLAPYIDYPAAAAREPWVELNRSTKWGAFHLWFDGRKVAWNAARAPKTMAALANLPQPQAPGRSPMAVFSVLQPNTRIPPHTGVSNTRLVVHLPLVVPDGCGFRVGSETRAWREGVGWVFDDTIEHEAWNESDQPRTILICDVWNPLLGESERQTIIALIAALDAFNQAEG